MWGAIFVIMEGHAVGGAMKPDKKKICVLALKIIFFFFKLSRNKIIKEKQKKKIITFPFRTNGK